MTSKDSKTKVIRYVVYYGSKSNPQSAVNAFDNLDSALAFYKEKSGSYEVQCWMDTVEVKTERLDV